MESTAQPDGAPPGPHPEPPADLDQRVLPLQTADASTTFIRIYAVDREALAFSPSGAGRFDAPHGEYGVVYAAADALCAFIETFGRDAGYRLVTRGELQTRMLAQIHLRRPLRLVDLTGPGLAALGADGRLCTGDYAIAQRWSLALWRHPGEPDGLLWRSRFDPSRTCVAIYEGRGALPFDAPPITATMLGCLVDPHHASLLREILDTYQFGFIDDPA